MTLEAEPDPKAGPAVMWLPIPSPTTYQHVLALDWSGAGRERLGFDPTYGAPALIVALDDEAPSRRVWATWRVATRDRAADLAAAGRANGSSLPEEVRLFLEPTPTMPTDAIVAETAAGIAGKLDAPIDKARAIYDWVVDNTFRDPKTKGCGLGDIRFMLDTGDLGGKCADINSLFVGLARAQGIPAREVFGMRIADSALFKSLGKSGDVSKAQHCRAEFYVAGYGWVPVDPADVRKAVLEEKLPLEHARIASLRERLFGSWEMNGVGFNHARDLHPSPEAKEPLNFFMYPEAETAKGPLDGTDPESFRYKITATPA